MTDNKRRPGPPKGHPPYRKRVLTDSIHLKLTPELKERIEAAAGAAKLKSNEWIREVITDRLDKEKKNQ